MKTIIKDLYIDLVKNENNLKCLYDDLVLSTKDPGYITGKGWRFLEFAKLYGNWN